jgi:hypothetical protein
LGRNRCGEHMSEARAFCGREKGHSGDHSPFPDDQGLRFPLAIKAVEKKIVKKRVEVARLESTKKALLSNLKIQCLGWTVGAKDGCKRWLDVKTLVYIQTHWYTEPFSCNGGDYWNQGEGQFMCPKCGAKNRLFERPQVAALSSFFKETKEVYDRN